MWLRLRLCAVLLVDVVAVRCCALGVARLLCSWCASLMASGSCCRLRGLAVVDAVVGLAFAFAVLVGCEVLAATIYGGMLPVVDPIGGVRVLAPGWRPNSIPDRGDRKWAEFVGGGCQSTRIRVKGICLWRVELAHFTPCSWWIAVELKLVQDVCDPRPRLWGDTGNVSAGPAVHFAGLATLLFGSLRDFSFSQGLPQKGLLWGPEAGSGSCGSPLDVGCSAVPHLVPVCCDVLKCLWAGFSVSE
eukprot:s2472_g11.t1